MGERRKPRITAREVGWLCEVDRLIRRYNCRGPAVLSAFSDVHDGGLYLREIEGLISRRILSPVQTDVGRRPRWDRHELMGHASGWTVDIQPWAAAALWPERTAGHQAIENQGGEP